MQRSDGARPHLRIVPASGPSSVLDRITIVPLDDPAPAAIDLTDVASERSVRPEWVLRLERQPA